MKHEEKKVDPVMESVRARDLVQYAQGRLTNQQTMSQRTLITVLLQANQESAWSAAVTYDEVASVLRSAVDTGDLVSYEKNDTTFYRLPSREEEAMRKVDRGQEPGSAAIVLDAAPKTFTTEVGVPDAAITLATLSDIGITSKVGNLITEMLATGLYGNGYDQFVREAICAHVREYVKGKK